MTKKVHVTITESEALAIETEYHRLHQELLERKKAGLESKRKKLTETMVRKAAIKLGLKRLKTLTYEEFERVLKNKT